MGSDIVSFGRLTTTTKPIDQLILKKQFESMASDLIAPSDRLVTQLGLQTDKNSDNLSPNHLYHDGNEGIGWHSDDEKSLEKNSTIASLSFGAERKFSFKHKQTEETISLVLEHGSLLIMKEVTQTNWVHSLPKSKIISGARINLTFRTMIC